MESTLIFFICGKFLVIDYNLIRKPHLDRYAVALQFPVVGIQFLDDGWSVFFWQKLNQYVRIVHSANVLPLETYSLPQYHLRRGSLVDIPLRIEAPVDYPLAFVVELQDSRERYGRIDLASVNRYRELERFRRVEYKLFPIERMDGSERLKFG